MAANAPALYPRFKLNLGKKLIDLSTDTFKMGLAISASNAASTTIENYADITGELPTAFGYTLGGQALTGVTWTLSGSTVTFDSNDVTWTASGGDITARYSFLFDDTSVSDKLVFSILLNNAPGDVTALNGNPLTISPSASGWAAW